MSTRRFKPAAQTRRRAPVRQFPAPPVELLAGLAAAAEIGHLAAAWMEWPDTVQRGIFHVVVAAALGLLAVGLYLDQRYRPAGLGLAAAVVVCWPLGALIGASPYLHFPVLAALAVTTAELILAVLLFMPYSTNG